MVANNGGKISEYTARTSLSGTEQYVLAVSASASSALETRKVTGSALSSWLATFGDTLTSASIVTLITGYNYITTFASATDVSVSSPTDNQGMFYSSAQSQWINRQGLLADISDSGALAGLDTLASASDYGSLLTSASAVTQYQPVGDYVTSASIDTMITGYNYITTFASATDVSVSSPTDLQTLFYSSAQAQWINRGVLTTDISDIGTYLTSASASTQYAQLNHTHVLASITDSGALAALDTLASASDYGLLLTSASAVTTYQPIGDYLTSASIASTYGALAGTNTWTGSNTFNNDLNVSTTLAVATLDLLSDKTAGNIGSFRAYAPTSAGVDRNVGALSFTRESATSLAEYSQFSVYLENNGSINADLVLQHAGAATQLEVYSSINTNLNLYSARSTANQNISFLQFLGQNASASNIAYGQIITAIEVNTSGAEAGKMDFRVPVAGTLTDIIQVSASGVNITNDLQARTYKTSAVVIADDAVHTVSLAANATGWLMVQIPGQSSRFLHTYFEFGGAGAGFDVIHQGTNASVYTSDLAGTTGTDTYINVGATVGSNNITIENRSGASDTISYMVMCYGE